MLTFLITNCLLHFMFAGASPLFDYEFYGEGYARESELSDYDAFDETEGSGHHRVIHVLKREVSDESKKVLPLVVTIHDTKVHAEDIECGTNIPSKNCTLRKRPTVVIEINERPISEETRKKIAEVQAEPVILTQGV